MFFIESTWFHHPDEVLDFSGKDGGSLLVYVYAERIVAAFSELLSKIAFDLHFYLFVIFAKGFRTEFVKRFIKRVQ